MRRAWLVILLAVLCTSAPAQGIRAPYQALADSVTRLMGFPPVAGNSVRFYHTGEAFLASLLEDIDAARESIDLEYYWLSGDGVGRPVRDALARKAQEGVRVRVVVDNRIVPLLPEYYFRSLEKAGAAMCFRWDFKKKRLWELPGVVTGERDHRKIVVLDGRVCYTGGMNLCHYTLEWDDTHMRIEGPLAVPLEVLFDQTWQLVSGDPPAELVYPAASSGGRVIAQLVHGDGSSALEETYVKVLDHVQRYIYFRSPYLVPPPALLEALERTARRGVDVRILLPLKSDWAFLNDITRYYIDKLHAAGVRLYTYAPSYDHTKSFVADDYLSCCGTVNLDNRSFYINSENTVFYYDETLARNSLADFMDMLSRADEVLPSGAPITGLEKTWVNFLLSIEELL